MALGNKSSSGEVLTMGTFNPAEMSEAGGLRASKFWGRVIVSRIRPADAGKQAKEPYGCYWELNIQPDESDIPVQTPRYRIGSLRDYCPSKDGRTAAGGSKQTFIMLADGRAKLEGEKDVETLSGPYFARLSEDGPQKTKGTNFEQFLSKLFALGVEIKSADSVVGLYAFWDEFIPEGRQNLQKDGNAPMWILVPTELGDKKSNTKKASKSAPVEPEEEEEPEEGETEDETEEEEEEDNTSTGKKDIDDLIAAAIVAKGKTKPKNTIKVDDIPALLMTLPKDRQAEAIRYWDKKEDLFEAGASEDAGPLWKYNKEKGVIVIL